MRHDSVKERWRDPLEMLVQVTVGGSAGSGNKFASSLDGWWARQDSNLQPDRYERHGLPGKARKGLARSATALVPVWLRRFVGQSLVRLSERADRHRLGAVDHASIALTARYPVEAET